MLEIVWDKDRIVALLNRNNEALERALLAIYNLQTIEEQESQNTSKHNNVGFNSVDAPILSSFANQIRINKYNKVAGERLSVKQRAIARTKVMKYWKQLLRIAKANQTNYESPVEVCE